LNTTERAGIQSANRFLAAARADLARGLSMWWVDRELERVGRMLERVLDGDFPRPEEYERPAPALTPSGVIAALATDDEPSLCGCDPGKPCSFGAVPTEASEAVDSLISVEVSS
jgi:hypothetical protein